MAVKFIAFFLVMGVRLAFDKAGVHHVITHPVSFEKYQLPQGSRTFIFQMMEQTLLCLESSIVVRMAVSLTLIQCRS